MLRFSDGENFDTSGNLRIEVRKDGMYVMGEDSVVRLLGAVKYLLDKDY